MEQQLTKAEMNYFKHGLPGERRILNGLTAVFGVSWTAVMIFVLYCFLVEWESDKRIDKDTVILAIGFVGAAVLFIVCVTCINKRNEKIYQSLKNGEYRVIISSVAAKCPRSPLYAACRTCYLESRLNFCGTVTGFTKNPFVFTLHIL